MKKIRRQPAPKGPLKGEAILDALAKMDPKDIFNVREIDPEEREQRRQEALERCRRLFPLKAKRPIPEEPDF